VRSSSSRSLIFTVLALTVGLAAAAPAGAQAPGPSPYLVISEVYGGGGNSGALFTHDFVELFNRGSASVRLDGRSLQYASATGNFGSTSQLVTPLSGTMEPGQYFLVQLAAGAGGTTPLPTPDLTGSTAAGATAGKFVVAEGTSALGCGATGNPCTGAQAARIVDLVGYGAASQFEGAGPAPGATNSTSVQRAGQGCQDSDNNVGDFTASPPQPQNSSSPRARCTPADSPPAVVDTDPDNGEMGVPRDADIRVTFSEPVDVTDDSFRVSCTRSGEVPFTVSGSSDGQTFTLALERPLEAGEECTVTVRAAGVADRDGDDPPDNPAADFSFSFTTEGLSGLRIHDIQGRQHLSPFRDLPVAGVPGVVTAIRQTGARGFYVQDPQPDSDRRTSEGIFVFLGSSRPLPPGLEIGDEVRVSGLVQEFRGGCTPNCTPPSFDTDPIQFGSNAYDNLTVTEIVSPQVAVGETAPRIPPTTVGQGGRTPPREVIDDDTDDPQGDDPNVATGNVEDKSGPPGQQEVQDERFDPDQDGIDFYESLEGMYTRVNNPVAVSPTTDFSVSPNRPRGSNSELPVLADNGAGASVRTPRGGIVARSFDSSPPQEYRKGDFNPERIILNDPIARERGQQAPAVDVRDRLSEPVDAVVDYSFGNFKFLALGFPPVQDGGLEREVTPRPSRDELRVATYNVENLDQLNDADRIDRIARQVVGNLRSPDIIGLEEVQDNDGETSEGNPNGDASWARIVQGIASAGGPRYAYRQIDPAPGQDGGVPGGNIRNGFLYRTDRVRFNDRGAPSAATRTEPAPGPGGAQLSSSPGRVEPENAVWARSRKPIAGEFVFRGEKVFVVANHFNSKGGDEALFGRFQDPRRGTEIQRRGTTRPVEDPQRGQAGVVNAWVRRLLDIDRDANVVVLGDLNDFDFSDTLQVLERGRSNDTRFELVNLWRGLPRAERYSYIFEGNAQTLDHILVSPNLLRTRPALDPVHLNSEFFEQESDHEPLVSRLRAGDGDDDDDGGGDRDDDGRDGDDD